MAKDEWNHYGYVLASEYRKVILRALAEKPKTPKQIADETKYNLSHVSRSIRQLEKRSLIKCLTPKRRKGKLYGLTDNGFRIFNQLSK
jgi:DNA-binding MarR family transcriptional regulator